MKEKNIKEQDLITFQLILNELCTAGFSKRALARFINIGKTTLYKYMSDTSVISEPYYIYILYQLKTQLPDLLNDCLRKIGREEPAELKKFRV